MQINKKLLQSGITLIELMIALTLGLVVTAITINIFTSQKSSYALHDAMSQIQQDGRFLTQYLAQQLRHTGRKLAADSTDRSYEALPALAQGNNGVRTNESNETDYQDTSSTLSDGTNLTIPYSATLSSDRLAVSFYDTTQNSLREDCVGNKVDIVNPATRALITNTYVLDHSTARLICIGSDTPAAHDADVVLENIEDFQVQYGIDISGAGQPLDGIVDLYQNADGPDVWNPANRIVAIRVSFMIRSINAIPKFEASNLLKLLDSPTVTTGSFNDRRLRKTFTFTAYLRNMHLDNT